MPFTLFKPHTWEVADTGSAGTPWVLPIGGQGQSWEVTISGQAGTAKIVARLWDDGTDAYGDYYDVDTLGSSSDTVNVVCAADVEYSVQCTLANETITWEVTPNTASASSSSSSSVTVSNNVTIATGSVTAAKDRYYLATTVGTAIAIPATMRAGDTFEVESGVEGTVKITAPGAGWKFVYPSGLAFSETAVQGKGGVIKCVIGSTPGQIHISGSGVPFHNGWHPTSDSSLNGVWRAGSHMPFYDYGGMGGANSGNPQTLFAASVTRWGVLFGDGALILDGTAITDTDSYAPRLESDPNYSFGQSLLMKSIGTTSRQLRATIPPTGPAFSVYMALRYLATPGSTGGRLLSLSTVNIANGGWGSFTGQPQCLVYNSGSNYAHQTIHNNLTVAWGTKPASANQSTNENTISPLWISLEVTAGGVCTIYSDETLVTQGGASSGAFTPDLFRIETGPPLNLAGVAIHNSVPADATERLKRQRFYKKFFS